MTSEPAAPALQPMPRDRAELMARIPPARAALVATIQGLSVTELSAPGPDGGWAVKDHLAHIATWERMICAHLRDGSDHAVVGLDPAAYEAMNLDTLNAHIDQRNRNRPAAEVLTEFHAAHHEIVAQLESLGEAELAAPYWQDEPNGRTVREKVAGDTYNHYIEHDTWIRAIVDAQTDAPG